MSLEPGARLGSCEIHARIGAGGMGEIYKATDTRLNRQVAIKVLPAEMCCDETAKARFLQEARAASALDHPNICTIYEIGDTPDRQLYLAMAYYDGETLKEKLARGPLGVEEAIDIASQVAQGLTKAHAAGIVHRDIKPANLMIAADGLVKILDFGIAKLAGQNDLTQTGTALGTPTYMSPEQVQGRDVDHHADLWALGVVLYEMLSGQQPFSGDQSASIIYSILEAKPAALASTTTSPLGTSVTRVVERALKKAPNDRYASAKLLLDALKEVAQASDAASAPSAAAGPSIAVLPFSDMSAQKDQDYFCEGIAEEILNALAKVDGLHVVARASAFHFKGKTGDIRQIGDALGVTSVLEGSVRTAGNRLRVTAQLINVADGYHLWSDRYDRQLDDVFAIQDEISESIVETLREKLVGTPVIARTERRPDNLDAYHLYLKGRQQWFAREEGGLDEARRYFEQAIELAPDYAEAYAGLAQTYAVFGLYDILPSKVALGKAKPAVERALSLNSSLAQAYAALGLVRFWLEWDWPGAQYAFQEARELDPNDPIIPTHQGFLLANLGRVEEAMAALAEATRLDPLSSYVRAITGYGLIVAGRYPEAIEICQQAVVRDENSSALFVLSLVHSIADRHADAIATGERLVTKSGRLPINLGLLGSIYGRAGRTGDAAAVVRELDDRAAREYVPALAKAWAGEFVDAETAIAHLEQAYDERNAFLFSLGSNIDFNPIFTHPRALAILKKMKLDKLPRPRM
ncbi:MAG: hypothetical protein CL471_13255 [Acidobacteria bacterium]|nr:hypothetical protein [Acidobacteriota bacterium]